MTSRERSTLALIGVLLAATAVAAHEAIAAPAPIDRPIVAVAQESARSGWPHTPTQREANAITYRISKFYLTGWNYGRIHCYNRYVDTAARWICNVKQYRYNPRTRTTTKPKSITVVVDFWEDGSFIFNLTKGGNA